MTQPSLDLRDVALLLLGAASCWHDLRTRRLPNVLTLGAAGLAVPYAIWSSGPSGAATAVLGWAAGLALFLPLFALGGLGAGDVKLLAAYGAWLGPSGALWTALYAAMAGGVLALVVALFTGYLGRALRNVSFIVTMWRTVGLRPVAGLTLDSARGPRLPYAVAIVAGALIVAWQR
jgi:prepilin peptidase CpaA